jgi:hypothetical protein
LLLFGSTVMVMSSASLIVEPALVVMFHGSDVGSANLRRRALVCGISVSIRWRITVN